MTAVKFLLVTAIFFQTNSFDLRIGSIVSKDDIAEFSTDSLILHNGDLKPSIQKKIDGISYRMAYEEKNRKVVQINTFDSSFKTVDGLKVDSFVKARQEQIIPTDNSVLGPKTADGWNTVVGSDYELIILKDGVESRVNLTNDLLSKKSAKKGLRKLFANSKTIMVKILQFSKF